MSYGRQKRLIERLLEKTRAGKIDWQESETAETFITSFSKYTLQISSLDFMNSKLYAAKIIDLFGSTTESFDDQDLDQDGVVSTKSWHSNMRELFELARRRAMGADEAIDSILSEIG